MLKLLLNKLVHKRLIIILYHSLINASILRSCIFQYYFFRNANVLKYIIILILIRFFIPQSYLLIFRRTEMMLSAYLNKYVINS